MAKALTENQCGWLHRRFPPPDCCICNHKGTIVVLEVENGRLSAEVAEMAAEKERLKRQVSLRDDLLLEADREMEKQQTEYERLRNHIMHMKRTTIGPDRSVPENTEIWFLFADEREALLTKGD